MEFSCRPELQKSKPTKQPSQLLQMKSGGQLQRLVTLITVKIVAADIRYIEL